MWIFYKKKIICWCWRFSMNKVFLLSTCVYDMLSTFSPNESEYFKMLAFIAFLCSHHHSLLYIYWFDLIKTKKKSTQNECFFSLGVGTWGVEEIFIVSCWKVGKVHEWVSERVGKEWKAVGNDLNNILQALFPLTISHSKVWMSWGKKC